MLQHNYQHNTQPTTLQQAKLDYESQEKTSKNTAPITSKPAITRAFSQSSKRNTTTNHHLNLSRRQKPAPNNAA
jgi:hypothetical protein